MSEPITIKARLESVAFTRAKDGVLVKIGLSTDAIRTAADLGIHVDQELTVEFHPWQKTLWDRPGRNGMATQRASGLAPLHGHRHIRRRDEEYHNLQIPGEHPRLAGTA